MAVTTVLKDAKIAVRGIDFSGVSNQVTLSRGVNVETSNVFGDTTEISTPTLLTASGSIGGFFDGPTEDAELSAILGSDAFVGIAQDGALGSRAIILKATFSSNNLSANHGEILKFSTDFAAAGAALEGTLMENGIFTAIGPGTGRQLSAVAAGQSLFAQLHVLTVAGGTPNFVAKIESDSVSGFGTPVDRITFTAATAVGVEQKSVVGAITDDFFRLNVTTISGTFTILLILAIA